MSLAIISRADWGAKDWQGKVYTWPLDQRTEFFVHYDGGVVVNRTGLAVPRAIQSVHLNNGWAGIGYNFVVDQKGNIFEGRGWNLVGAHCPNHNRSGIGVQVAIGDGQTPSDAALNAVVDLYLEACAKAGHVLAKRGHKDGYSTDCPGDKLYAWVRAGMKRPGGSTPRPPLPQPQPKPGVPAPKFPLPRGWYFGPKDGPRESVSGFFGHSSELKVWQTRMKKRGWDIAPDGKYGPETRGVALNFQKEFGLSRDGLIGDETWHTAWTARIN